MSSVEVDPITYEVLQNAFSSLVNEMSISIEKSAYSLVITEGKDFSSALYSADGELVAQGDFDLPGQIGAMQFAMQSTIEYIGRDSFAPGDVVITNDPTLTGTHLQDVKMLSPVFHGGVLVAFVGTTGHWPDIGGAAAGGFSATATEVYQEGLRIRPVKLYKEGLVDTELLNLILDNIRIPDERLGDLRAQAGACHLGAARIEALCAKYGPDVVAWAMQRSIAYAEQLLRRELAALPDGEWSFEEHLDTNGLERTPSLLRVTVRIGAIAKVVPDRAYGALYGSFNNFVLSGYDSLRERPFVLYIWGEGGWGGRATKDGVSAAMHLVAAGTSNQPSEALEHRFPILAETYALRPDSGGPGRFRGGLGIVREIRLLDDGVVAIGSGDRQDFTPWGVFGGGNALGSEWAVERRSERRRLPPRFEKVVLEQGDVICYASPGGGGYGPPLERAPERVRDDVANGYVTPEAAARVYGPAGGGQ